MPEAWRYTVTWKGQETAIAGEASILGRSRSCDVQIADSSVSRNHVQVTAADGALVVEDLGSSNGTFVNGEPIYGRTAVRNGDTLGVGDAELIVSITGTAAAPLPPAQGFGDATLFLQQQSMGLVEQIEELTPQSSEPVPHAPEVPEAPFATIALNMANVVLPTADAAPEAEPWPPKPLASTTPAPTPPASTPLASATPAPTPPSPMDTILAMPPEMAIPDSAPPAPSPMETMLAEPLAPPPPVSLPPAVPRSQAAAPSPAAPSPAAPSPAAPSAESKTDDARAPQRNPESSTSESRWLDTSEFAALPTPTVPTPMPGPKSTKRDPATRLPAAAMSQRFAAWIIDAALYAITAGVLWLVLGLNEQSQGWQTALLIASAIAPIVLVVGWGLWGTTPGKRSLRLYVCTSGGQPGVGFARASIRTLAWLLSLATLGIGFAMAAGPTGLALHDRLARTYVARLS